MSTVRTGPSESELALRPATELAALLRTGVVSSRDLLEEHLERISRLDPVLGAVVTLDAEGARAQAVAADRALSAGEPAGPLHGLPVTVKDCLETRGMRTTSGSTALVGYVPDQDATVVARLRAAGAIIVGKTNLPEWAGDSQTSNELFGETRNPWNLSCSPGGSSGGPAVATAAGLSAFDLGSDLGGSIRLPASACGVYGLKPTHGIVPTRGHIPPGPGTRSPLDIGCIGPLARDAADLDLALGIIAGPDPVRAVAWRLDLPAPRAGRLQDYRIGVWLEDEICPLDSAVLDTLSAAVDALGSAGVPVVDVASDLQPTFAETYELSRALIQAAVVPFLPQEAYDHAVSVAADEGASEEARRWARHVTATAPETGRRLERRAALAEVWAELFDRVDVVLMPVLPTTALPHDPASGNDRQVIVNGRPFPYGDQFPWVQVPGALHLPVVAAPAGLARNGLPVGIQVVGPLYGDRTVIDVARRMADVVGGYQPPPIAVGDAR